VSADPIMTGTTGWQQETELHPSIQCKDSVGVFTKTCSKMLYVTRVTQSPMGKKFWGMQLWFCQVVRSWPGAGKDHDYKVRALGIGGLHLSPALDQPSNLGELQSVVSHLVPQFLCL
jgi:hypothetical protein